MTQVLSKQGELAAYLLHQNQLGQESLLKIKDFPGKLVQPSGRTSCSHLSLFKRHMPFNPTILLLEIYPYTVTEKKMYKNTHYSITRQNKHGKKHSRRKLNCIISRRLVK